MARIAYHSTLDEGLLLLAKGQAEEEGLPGVNVLLEKALQLYFSNFSTTVWEKPLGGGSFQKIIVRPNKKVVFETVKKRKVLKFHPEHYAEDVLKLSGWFQVWKCRVGKG